MKDSGLFVPLAHRELLYEPIRRRRPFVSLVESPSVKAPNCSFMVAMDAFVSETVTVAIRVRLRGSPVAWAALPVGAARPSVTDTANT